MSIDARRLSGPSRRGYSPEARMADVWVSFATSSFTPMAYSSGLAGRGTLTAPCTTCPESLRMVEKRIGTRSRSSVGA
jgi:hypothetical protein